MKKTPDIFAGRPETLRIAICQVFTREWDLEGNLLRCLEALREAARQGADLAVLPECVFHGYATNGPGDYRHRTRSVAEPADGPRVTAIREAARGLDLSVVVGFAERGDLGAIHNSAAYISAEGVLENLYRKVHCRDFESIEHRGMYTPGDAFSTYTIRAGGHAVTAGTIICFDREVPESIRCLRSLGAHLVLCPLACDTMSFAHRTDHVHNEILTACRAAENEVFIVVVNHAGRFNGGSFIVGPGGELLHQMGSEAGVHVQDVPVGCIASRFHGQPLGWMGWGFRRPEVYAKYLLEPVQHPPHADSAAVCGEHP